MLANFWKCDIVKLDEVCIVVKKPFRCEISLQMIKKPTNLNRQQMCLNFLLLKCVLLSNTLCKMEVNKFVKQSYQFKTAIQHKTKPEFD